VLRADLETCFAGNPKERLAGGVLLARRLRSVESRRKGFEQQQIQRQTALAKLERGYWGRYYTRSQALEVIIALAPWIVLALVASFLLFR
jgi:hypothetical protein